MYGSIWAHMGPYGWPEVKIIIISDCDFLRGLCPGDKENGCTIPEEGLAMIRFHSFYPWHDKRAYTHLEAPGDIELMNWVKEFNKFDLYSKGDESPWLITWLGIRTLGPLKSSLKSSRKYGSILGPRTRIPSQVLRLFYWFVKHFKWSLIVLKDVYWFLMHFKWVLMISETF